MCRLSSNTPRQEIQPPAQPSYILRGHSSQVHHIHFTPGNRRLLTGDADGWVVSWNLSFKRPVAVWKAHASTILGVGSWGDNLVITHGRDNKLIVWLVGEDQEKELDVTLPVDQPTAENKHPWMLHCLTVNALNFCAFATCDDRMPQSPSPGLQLNEKKTREPILIALPNNVDSNGIDVYQLPSESRVAQIQASRDITAGMAMAPGMVMALGIHTQGTRIQIAAGYESGHTAVFVQNDSGDFFQLLYTHRSHDQPVLSLFIAPSKDYYITSSADQILAKHPFPMNHGAWQTASKPLKLLKTKHSGQQGASTRSDGRIFATGGWDSKVRVYASKTMKELAVLKWHKEGCYTTAFAHVSDHPMAKPQKPPCPTMMAMNTPSTTNYTDNENNAENGANLPNAEPSSSTAKELFDEQAKPLALCREGGMSACNTLTSSSNSPTDGLVQRRRDEKAQTTHWLAAGSKDGKISLWDIY